MDFADIGPDHCVHLCSLIGYFCSLTYITVSTVSVSRQRNPSSAHMHRLIRVCVIHKLQKGLFVEHHIT